LLRQFPHGTSVRGELPTGIRRELIATDDKKIALASRELEQELDRLLLLDRSPEYPFRLIGMRELLSMNSWLHNASSCMPARRRHQLHMSPLDAEHLAIADGDQVTVISEAGRVRVPVKLSDRMKPGNVALPHGWGHHGGWNGANDVEPLAAMSILNGIAVRIEVGESFHLA
jgi:formate dehydrogenase